jgi:hypothetical protein
MPSGAAAPLFTAPPRGRPHGSAAHPQATLPERPATADHRQLCLTPGRRVGSRVAGLFLFLPLLARLGWDRLISQAGYPGSRMVPAPAALLSLLAVKLLDKERRSHIDDFNCDEAVGLFAGLNIPPKKSYAADYSYRTEHAQQHRLLAGWVAGLAPVLFPQAEAFCLDFHAVPYRGEPEALENHYLPTRGKASPSILTFFAHEPHSRVLCYANANLTRADQPGELMRFVEFWHSVTGRDPQWLYFDSKLVPYAELARVNERPIWFVTIRRRGAAIVRRLQALPAASWQRAVIDIPKRRHQNIRYHDERTRLRDYAEPIRQVAVTGLGRDNPTLCLSNNFTVTARDLITRYAGRNGIEDSLGISVDFFHLDCLASEVRLNVDLDVALTVIAHGCYRWLAKRLRGFDKAKPKQLYRRFVETGGVVEVCEDRLVVHFDKRCHNPILKEAGLDRDCPGIPWLRGLPVSFQYP